SQHSPRKCNSSATGFPGPVHHLVPAQNTNWHWWQKCPLPPAPFACTVVIRDVILKKQEPQTLFPRDLAGRKKSPHESGDFPANLATPRATLKFVKFLDKLRPVSRKVP